MKWLFEMQILEKVSRPSMNFQIFVLLLFCSIITTSKFIYFLKLLLNFVRKIQFCLVMGIKGRRVHMIEELSETIISFQRGKVYMEKDLFVRHQKPKLFTKKKTHFFTIIIIFLS